MARISTARSSGPELAALLAGGTDAGGHVPRSEQLGEVGVEQRAARRRLARELDHVRIARRVAFGDPGAAAFLHEPQAHHVLEQPDRAAEAALVREVRGVGLLGDERDASSSTPTSDQVPLEM